MVFILRVFQISIWRIRTERFSDITFGPEYSFYLFAGILGIEANLTVFSKIFNSVFYVIHLPLETRGDFERRISKLFSLSNGGLKRYLMKTGKK